MERDSKLAQEVAEWWSFRFQEQNLAGVLVGEVQDCPVEGGQYQFLADGQAKQPGIGDLIVTEKAIEEDAAEGLPVGGNRLISIAWLKGQLCQHRRGFFHAQATQFRSGHIAQEARLSERANGPLKAGSVEPLCGGQMVDVVFVEKRHQHVYIEQVPRGLRHNRPPRLLLPSLE